MSGHTWTRRPRVDVRLRVLRDWDELRRAEGFGDSRLTPMPIGLPMSLGYRDRIKLDESGGGERQPCREHSTQLAPATRPYEVSTRTWATIEAVTFTRLAAHQALPPATWSAGDGRLRALALAGSCRIAIELTRAGVHACAVISTGWHPILLQMHPRLCLCRTSLHRPESPGRGGLTRQDLHGRPSARRPCGHH